MYQQFTDKIRALEAEITQTENRMQANIQDMERQKSTVEKLESNLLKARKAFALDDSEDNQEAVADLQDKVTKAKDDLDSLQILDEALKDKNVNLESELKSTSDALNQAEIERMVSKADGLLAEYDVAIRAANKVKFYLIAMQREIGKRNGSKYLRATCPAVLDLKFLPGYLFTTVDPTDPTRPLALNGTQYDNEQIVKELIA
jgi:DNA repair exonuclease SbcCD ATPase subunit